MKQAVKVGLAILACMTVLELKNQALAANPDLSSISSYSEINLSDPQKSTPLVVSIDRSQSIAYRWKPWQRVKVWAYVHHPGGRAESLKDRNGRSWWEVRLNSHGEGKLVIFPAAENYTGQLIVKGNGKRLLGRTV